jgi:formylglycine-generating enzyme required for sulfatase activity
MVVIAPGQSTIVSASAESSAEPGRQAVSIAYRYAIGRYEVTRAEFAAFAAESGHQAKGCWTYDGQWSHRADLDWRTPGYEQQDQHPVTCVSWLDAQAYLGWLKKKTGQAYRLPSSSEWKHASGVDSESLGQAPRQREVCKLANVADLSAEQQYAGWTVHACRDGYVHTAPVGRFQPNSRGIHDMLGNVFEWVEDCWADSPRAAPADGSALLQGDCGQRVLHGGSWFTIPRYVDPEFRNRLQTSHRASSVGFRVMRPVAG